MTTSMRGRWVAAAVAVYAAWVGLQVWLAHHLFVVNQAAERAQATRGHELLAQRAHTLGLPPPPPLHLYTWPSSFWLRLAAEGAAGMLLVLAVGLALVAGGRRWWSLIVAGIPAAVVVGKFGDGQPIGAAWAIAWDHTQRWLLAGVVIDTAVVAAVVALLVRGLPRTPAAAATGALLRAAVPAVILVGWWLIQNPVDADGSRRVWIAQAVVWIALVVLVATAALPAYAKLVTIAVVAPYLSATMLSDLILTSTPHFDRVQFTHHLLFALAVAGYAAGAPLVAKLGKRDERNELASESGALSRA